jgi:hypothetical protein
MRLLILLFIPFTYSLDCNDVDVFGNLYISDTITEILNSQFYSCTNLKTITGGNNIVTIGQKAFYYTNLQIAIFPAVISVDYMAFYYNSGMDTPPPLVSVDMQNVQIIGDWVFSHQTNLVNLIVPNVITIGKTAFLSTGISNIYWPMLKTIDHETFASTSITKFSAPLLQDDAHQIFHDVDLTIVYLPSLNNTHTFTSLPSNQLACATLNTFNILVDGAWTCMTCGIDKPFSESKISCVCPEHTFDHDNNPSNPCKSCTADDYDHYFHSLKCCTRTVSHCIDILNDYNARCFC